MINILPFILRRGNLQLRKVDTVHAQDLAAMSVNQLRSNLKQTKKTERK